MKILVCLVDGVLFPIFRIIFYNCYFVIVIKE